MDAALEKKFLEYSAAEPMALLRKKFHQGQSLYQSVPDTITAQQALEDIDYVQYVLENAYSGYPYHEKQLFDKAFRSIREILEKESCISASRLIDTISDQLAFLCDGHLSFTTEEYGRGFYRRTATFVSDVLLEESGGQYFDAATHKPVELCGGACAFPTVSCDHRRLYLAGLSSKQEAAEMELLVDGVLEKISLHEIRSKASQEEILIQEEYQDDLAVISCGTFVADAEQELPKFKRAGETCRGYRHVIWDLSGNLGGNSAFAEEFLTGLNGSCRSGNVIRSLHSSLVYAKEHGEVKQIDYHFTDEQGTEFTGEDLYKGTLHVIMNNAVASSGELALVYASSLPNVIFYGCNTLGIGQFGDLCIYYLPNSRVTLWCPQKVFNTVIPETEGMKPDFWIDSSDVVSAVKKGIRAGISDR